MSEVKKLPAVLKEDLLKILAALGEIDNIQKELVYCCQCGVTIRLDNFGLFTPLGNNKYEYVCSSTECVEAYNSNEGEG